MNEGGSSELGGPCLCSFSLAPRALVGDGEEGLSDCPTCWQLSSIQKIRP